MGREKLHFNTGLDEFPGARHIPEMKSNDLPSIKKAQLWGK